MLIQATLSEAKAVLGVMRRVATGDGRQTLSKTCASGLRSAAQYVFPIGNDIRLDALPGIGAAELAWILATRAQSEAASRFLAVMSLVDREDYVKQLAEACHNLDWVLHDMTRQNIESLWDEPWDGSDITTVILPYRQQSDLDPASRYQALGELAPGTFSRAFWEIYQKTGYAFPGLGAGSQCAIRHPA